VSDLSPKQQRILDFIRQHMEDHSFPPSIREICGACEISSTSVADYNLNALERKGYIRRNADISRGIEIVGFGRSRGNVVRVPVIGKIAAGRPIPVPEDQTWTEDAEEVVELTPAQSKGKSRLYALQVQGQSMIDALINDGDVVVMEPADTADNGEMVAAWIKSQSEATLKKFYREGPQVRLQPANATMGPITVDADDVEVQGKVVAVLRSI
jgi:repressor LexA